MLPNIQVGFQVFISDGGEEVGAVRQVAPFGRSLKLPARAPPRGPPYWRSTVLRRKTFDDIDSMTSAAFDS